MRPPFDPLLLVGACALSIVGCALILMGDLRASLVVWTSVAMIQGFRLVRWETRNR